jgi:hypothetical protein
MRRARLLHRAGNPPIDPCPYLGKIDTLVTRRLKSGGVLGYFSHLLFRAVDPPDRVAVVEDISNAVTAAKPEGDYRM